MCSKDTTDTPHRQEVIEKLLQELVTVENPGDHHVVMVGDVGVESTSKRLAEMGANYLRDDILTPALEQAYTAGWQAAVARMRQLLDRLGED